MVDVIEEPIDIERYNTAESRLLIFVECGFGHVDICTVAFAVSNYEIAQIIRS